MTMFSQLTILLSAKDYMLPCLNKKLFGIDCPGCGMQRAVNLLLHGDFVEAFKMYPAVYPIVLLLLFLISNLFLKLKYAHQIKFFLMLVTAGTIIISYILKMNSLFN
ncbi:DUF2752 domain-containing protein [Flagellimonas flava]|uniref:DUF2752 domain-containing protein n=2 Tax=Flagellimonas flava TaxID=570519 RepID=UPI003D65D30B